MSKEIIECKGRNGWFNFGECYVWDTEGEAFVHIYSSKRGKNSPITINGPRDQLARLFQALADNLRTDNHAKTILAGDLIPSNQEEQAKLAYFAQNGTTCPHCGSSDIAGESVESGSGQASQEMSCPHCCGEWKDQYRLSNVTFYTVPTPEDIARAKAEAAEGVLLLQEGGAQ